MKMEIQKLEFGRESLQSFETNENLQAGPEYR
jgi:hypothetical protein